MFLMALDNPRRIVIDFPGVQSGVWPASFRFPTGPVARIRVGQHADKVRVVLELRAAVSSHGVQLTATGAKIVLETPNPGSTPHPQDARKRL